MVCTCAKIKFFLNVLCWNSQRVNRFSYPSGWLINVIQWNFIRSHLTRCTCKTRGITLKAIVLELCPFLTEILSRMMTPDRRGLVPLTVPLFCFCKTYIGVYYSLKYTLCSIELIQNNFIFSKSNKDKGR